MATKQRTTAKRKARPTIGRGLVREVAYLPPDEEDALRRFAERKRLSKSEVIRRALREFIGDGD